MVWLPTTTCRPNVPNKRLRPQLLRNMCFIRRLLPSIAKQANLESRHHWPAKKFMGSMRKWDHESIPCCNYGWASPMQILYSLTHFRSPTVNHHVCHATTHMAVTLVHRLEHTTTQSCPATRPPSIPPLWKHSSIWVSRPLFRKRCTATA